jgi:hypothetical protein
MRLKPTYMQVREDTDAENAQDGYRVTVNSLIQFGNRADCPGRVHEYKKVNSKAKKEKLGYFIFNFLISCM